MAELDTKRLFTKAADALDYAEDLNVELVEQGLQAKVRLDSAHEKWGIVVVPLEYDVPLSQLKQIIRLSPEERELVRKGIPESIIYNAAYKRELERIKQNPIRSYKPVLIKDVGDREATEVQTNINNYISTVFPFMLSMNIGRNLGIVSWSRHSGPLVLHRNMDVSGMSGTFKAPIRVENDRDIDDFMARRQKYVKSGLTKGVTTLFTTLNDGVTISETGKLDANQVEFIIVDFDIEDDYERLHKQEIRHIIYLANRWFEQQGFYSKMIYTGSSWHVLARSKDIVDTLLYSGARYRFRALGTYEDVKLILVQLRDYLNSRQPIYVGWGPLGKSGHGINIDYATTAVNKLWRFPLSIHQKTGLVSIIVNYHEEEQTGDMNDIAHPDTVLDNIDEHMNRIVEMFIPQIVDK